MLNPIKIQKINVYERIERGVSEPARLSGGTLERRPAREAREESFRSMLQKKLRDTEKKRGDNAA